MSSANDWNQNVINEFRVNAGKVGGPFEGKSLLLLHTIGAKTGQERINPVVCVEDGERLVIIASKAGAPTHPAWYHDIVANPHITVEYKTEIFQVNAEITTEPERSRLYGKMVKVMPGFADYQQKTSRVIPVIVLYRREI
jgi:deazaflavin-dependent oxidoreductase (nitroreductase family)